MRDRAVLQPESSLSIAAKPESAAAVAKNIAAPKPEEIAKDLGELEGYRTDLKKRQKRLSEERELLEEPPVAEVI